MAFLAKNGVSQSLFLNKWTLIQGLMVVATLLAARFFTSYTDEPIRERLRQIEGQRGLLRFLVIVHNRLFWILAAIFLWVGYLILQT